MLPSTIFGSVITASGAKPFVLQVSSGDVALGRYAPANNRQASLARDVIANIERQVRTQVAGVSGVRIGCYQCDKCGRWVDVAARPNDWRGERCSRCE